MLDLGQLLPHCKRDAKLDTKSDRGVINEVADMKVSQCGASVRLASLCSGSMCHYLAQCRRVAVLLNCSLKAHNVTSHVYVLLAMQGCSSVLFFEARKRQDLYVWLAKAPDGPSIKFHCANGKVHHLSNLDLSEQCCIFYTSEQTVCSNKAVLQQSLLTSCCVRWTPLWWQWDAVTATVTEVLMPAKWLHIALHVPHFKHYAMSKTALATSRQAHMSVKPV